MRLKPSIGLGITTYNRPDYFSKCINSVIDNLLLIVDEIVVYNDGSKEDYQAIYDRLPNKIRVEHCKENKGVARAKNWCLDQLKDCDFIFLLEDDILIKSPKAVTEYVKVSQKTGIGHLMFAHHGPMNVENLLWSDPNGIELYRHCVGAWTMFTKEVLEKVGYLDENFKNAYEHVEHTFRIAQAGKTTDWPYFADVKGSNNWLGEQPNSIKNSAIRKDRKWAVSVIGGLIYWRNKDPENFPLYEELEHLKRQAGMYDKDAIKNV